MKTNRQELVSFMKWVISQKPRYNWMPAEKVVESYLEDTNSNPPAESRAVGTHEDKGRICPTCKGRGQTIRTEKYHTSIITCPDCGGLGQI